MPIIQSDRSHERALHHLEQQRCFEPLLVKPRAACSLLGCGNTRLYALLAAGELESFLDGRSRKITVESIQRYIARQLASAGLTNTSPPRRRGRPRKIVDAGAR